MDRSPTRRPPTHRTHKKTLSFRTGCARLFNVCRWCSNCLSDVIWKWNHPRRVWSLLPWLLCLGWRFCSLALCRWTWVWDLCCSCFNYTHKNTPSGVSVCQFLDWHRLGSISHSCALRWLVISLMLFIAVSPITQPHEMTNRIKTYLI